jgi:hypothetical protein
VLARGSVQLNRVVAPWRTSSAARGLAHIEIARILIERQQLVGAPNHLRFPDYLSLDMGLEKRFRFHKREWAIRASCINVTGHNNPDSVVNNIDALNYLSFAGGHTRSVTGRLRLVTHP